MNWSGWTAVWSYLGFLVSLVTLVIVAAWFFTGQPAKHCRYFVPVVGHPHVYSCSEYTKAVKP